LIINRHNIVGSKLFSSTRFDSLVHRNLLGLDQQLGMPARLCDADKFQELVKPYRGLWF
jgi:hypothetical protein